jgi:hypothetical protein
MLRESIVFKKGRFAEFPVFIEELAAIGKAATDPGSSNIYYTLEDPVCVERGNIIARQVVVLPTK